MSRVLQHRPNSLQILGVIAVLLGVGVASWPAAGSSGSSAAAAVAAVEPVYLVVCAASFVFPALATIIKEHIFKSAAKRLGGKQLDVLIVNAYCSTAQVCMGLFAGLVLGHSVSVGPKYA
jgi:drug/metabolite transporter (DMT)-like permease